MINSRCITTCLVLLLISSHLSWCLRCYECNYGLNGGQPECQNPKDDGSVVIKERQLQDNTLLDKFVEKWKPEESTGRQNNREACGALFGSFDGTNGIIRAKTNKNQGSPGCLVQVNTQLSGVQFVGDICICTTIDLCNGKNDRLSYGPSTVYRPPGQPQAMNSSATLSNIGLVTTLLITAKIIVFLT